MKDKSLSSIRNIGYLFSSARHLGVQCPAHLHNTMEIVLVTQGTLNMTVSGREYDIPEGYGICVLPFEAHLFSSAVPNRCHILEFSKGFVSHFFELVKGKALTNHLFPISEASMSLSETLLPNVSNMVDYVSAEAVLAPLCYDVLHGCSFEERKQPLDDTVSDVLKYIDEHFHEDVSLESTAKAVGVHPVTISKMFAQHAGLGFHDYLQYRRCEHATFLIKTTNMTFSEIAYESGFGSIRSFNRLFYKIRKMTPTQYKNTFSLL